MACSQCKLLGSRKALSSPPTSKLLLAHLRWRGNILLFKALASSHHFAHHSEKFISPCCYCCPMCAAGHDQACQACPPRVGDHWWQRGHHSTGLSHDQKSNLSLPLHPTCCCYCFISDCGQTHHDPDPILLQGGSFYVCNLSVPQHSQACIM